jgi:hypothetical protein
MSIPSAESSVLSLTNAAKKSEVTLAADVSAADVPSTHTAEPPTGTKKGLRFWLILLAICTSTFLSALELVSHITALLLLAVLTELSDRAFQRIANHRT